MVKDYIIDWFAKKSTMSREELINNFDIAYLENGLIDSLSFLELTTDCEEEFNIVFDDDDFADDGFFRISGLVDIIESKLK